MAGITNETMGADLVKMQCFPFYSLLLAIGNPTVNLLSLDIEGAEFDVIMFDVFFGKSLFHLLGFEIYSMEECQY